MNLAVPLLGPLAGPECRRALARGWLILVRVLAALAILGALLVDLWVWWMSQGANHDYLPFWVLRYGLMVIEGMMVTIALVLGPAVLAGSIAGEKERGVLALLLTTRIGTREIVTGRLTGKLTQVAMILLAGVPAVVALSALAGMNLATLAVLLGLPAAVALGGGGLAVLTSTVSRRGRDALLTVYLIDVLFLLSPLGVSAAWVTGWPAWFGTLNPYVCLVDLTWNEALTSSLVSMGLWLAIGLLSTAVAAWRLRPACLRPMDGERLLRGGKRRGRVPRIDEQRPMLWKELHIERAGALGGFGWWLGALLVVLLGGGSLVLGGLVAWSVATSTGAPTARIGLHMIDDSAFLIGWLIEWAVGLRASVAISSERERGTWDALLTSPLEGREIVRGKLWGSLYALRWLFIAALLAWTISAGCGAMSPWDYASTVAGTAIAAAFMAAVGVRTSLASSTATRAMAITIGVWLGSSIVVTALAGLLLGLLFLLIGILTWLASASSTLVMPWVFRATGYVWPLTINAIYLAATLMLVADTRLRFDRIAGRMTAGRFASAVDAAIHGRPRSPWRPKARPADLVGDGILEKNGTPMDGDVASFRGSERESIEGG